MKKRLSSIALIALLLLAAGFTYAYWKTVIVPNDASSNTSVEIGEGEAITTQIDLSDVTDNQGKLVPAGFAGEGQTEELIITYDVLWAGTNADGAQGSLTISATSTEPLLNIEVPSPVDITAGTTKQVTIKVTLTEPADYYEYIRVANQTFTVELVFIVTLKD